MESNDTEHVYPDRPNVEEEHLPQIPGTYTDSPADLSTTREEQTTGIQLEIVKKEYDSEGTELEGDINPNVCSADRAPPGETPWALTTGDETADELEVFDTAHATKDELHLEAGSDNQQDSKSDSTNPPDNRSASENATAANSEKPYVCDVCGKGFTKVRSMKLHQRIHINSRKEKKQHICKVCHKHFDLPCLLKQHMARPRVHRKKENKQYACEVCNKRFSRPFHLDVHMAVHSKEKPHQCNVCGKRFSHTLYLSAHKRRHSGYRPHKCEICGLGFMKLTDLRRHKLVHSGERPYQCQICAKSFRLKGTLAQHIKTHTKPCQPCCKQACEQNYAQSQQYQHAATVCNEQVSDNQHAAIVGKEQVIDNQDAATICKEEFQDDQHTETVGEKQVVYVGMHKTLLTTDHCKHCVVVKPHKCSVCGRSFARPYQLKSHQMVHRDRQLFKCFFCDTDFKTTSSLRSHQLHCVARPIRCSVCGQGFANTEELSNHRASKHTGWNQCKCDGCGQHIDSPSLLKSHKLVCSGKPRFKCQVCNKTLTSRQSLKAHMNIHVVTPLVL